MSRQKYGVLIDQLCEKYNIENSQLMHDVCNLQVNGITFSIMYGGDADADSLYIYCNVGKPPAELEQIALRRLMESNLFMYGLNAPTFAFDPQTEHVILVSRMAVSKATLELLIAMMSNLSIYGHLWRKNYLLTDSEREQMAESASMPEKSTDASRVSAPLTVEPDKAPASDNSGMRSESASPFPGVSVEFLESDEIPLSGFIRAELQKVRGQNSVPEPPPEFETTVMEMERQGVFSQGPLDEPE